MLFQQQGAASDAPPCAYLITPCAHAARLQDFDDRIVEAAYDLGAGPWCTFFKVELPILLQSIVAGGLLAIIPHSCQPLILPIRHIDAILGNQTDCGGNFLKVRKKKRHTPLPAEESMSSRMGFSLNATLQTVYPHNDPVWRRLIASIAKATARAKAAGWPLTVPKRCVLPGGTSARKGMPSALSRRAKRSPWSYST